MRRFSKINPSANVQSSHSRFDLFGLRRGSRIIDLSCKQVCDRTIQQERHAKQLNQALLNFVILDTLPLKER